MPSDAQIREAERAAQKQRIENARLLRISADQSRDGDVDLATKVLAAAKGDAAAYDRALASPKVNDLFHRGVLFFAKPNQGN